jgi:hypothetical protein
VYNNPGFRTLVGCTANEEIGYIQSFLIYMWFDSTGETAVKSSVNISGEKGPDGSGMPFSQLYPVQALFQVVRGKLKTEYLEEKQMDYMDVPTPEDM